MLIRKATLCSFGSRLTPPLIKIAVKIVNRPLRSPYGTRLQGYERELLDADEFPRHPTTKGPEGIVHTICEALDHFSHFKIDNDSGGMVTFDGWGNQRCIRQ